MCPPQGGALLRRALPPEEQLRCDTASCRTGAGGDLRRRAARRNGAGQCRLGREADELGAEARGVVVATEPTRHDAAARGATAGNPPHQLGTSTAAGPPMRGLDNSDRVPIGDTVGRDVTLLSYTVPVPQVVSPERVVRPLRRRHLGCGRRRIGARSGSLVRRTSIVARSDLGEQHIEGRCRRPLGISSERHGRRGRRARRDPVRPRLLESAETRRTSRWNSCR